MTLSNLTKYSVTQIGMLTGTRVPGTQIYYPNPGSYVPEIIPEPTDPWFGHDPVGSGSVRNRLQIGRQIAYSTDVNKRVHCVRNRPQHTRDDCKLGG